LVERESLAATGFDMRRERERERERERYECFRVVRGVFSDEERDLDRW
jgi:hypothetical protein